jgi:hypothetical protein
MAVNWNVNSTILKDHSQLDDLGSWYESVHFGAAIKSVDCEAGTKKNRVVLQNNSQRPNAVGVFNPSRI